MKICLTLILAFLTIHFSIAKNNGKAILKDFKKISGRWEGSLTYLDYSSGKPYSMPANLKVYRLQKTSQFVFSKIYPKEVRANANDTFIISNNGKYIDAAVIKSRKNLPNGDIEITTEETGTDGNDNKPATIKHTYLFGKTILKIMKEVQFMGGDNWIKRNEYVFSRKLSGS